MIKHLSFIHLFIHSLSKYVRNTQHALGTALSAEPNKENALKTSDNLHFTRNNHNKQIQIISHGVKGY